MDQSPNQEYEIDLLHLIKLVLRKWIVVGVITVAVTLVVAGYAFIMLDDTYTANSSMLVQAQDTETSDYQNLLTGQRLVDTYKEIARSNRVLEELSLNTGGDLSVASLRSMITVSSVNDTLIVKLSVETEDPELSALIANEAVSIVQDLSNEFNGIPTQGITIDQPSTQRSL